MSKIIKDCIYGHIHVPELCVKFMDVPEFQRLHRIKQLGLTYYTYPSATHTRFEHSLGVMHLSGKIVDQLRNNAEISERTKHIIQLAGMYHDIGHFAFSHLFDKFLDQININDNIHDIFKLRHHEDRSIYLLLQVNSRLKLLSKEEENFVKDIINGDCKNKTEPYLYQIVCNSECGIDADKMDYLNRDSQRTGLPGFQSDYIILNTILDNDKFIAFKIKAKRDIQDLFDARRRMFDNVYHHHTTIKLEKIYLCFMERLGSRLFQYGEHTDDYNIESLIRTLEDLRTVVSELETRKLNHNCEYCNKYTLHREYKSSGTVDEVRFIIANRTTINSGTR